MQKQSLSVYQHYSVSYFVATALNNLSSATTLAVQKGWSSKTGSTLQPRQLHNFQLEDQDIHDPRYYLGYFSKPEFCHDTATTSKKTWE